MIYKAIVFLPLIGFLIAGLFGRQIGAKASEYVTTGLMIIVAVLSWIVFFNVAMSHEAHEVIKVPVLRWIQDEVGPRAAPRRGAAGRVLQNAYRAVELRH